jgi:hypothetical protein
MRSWPGCSSWPDGVDLSSRQGSAQSLIEHLANDRMRLLDLMVARPDR